MNSILSIPRCLRILLILALFFTVAACTSQSTPLPITMEQPLPAVSLYLGSSPSIQYAPFYAADKMDFFRDAGIIVTFEYGFDTDGVAMVAVGDTSFAVVSGEQVLLARAQGFAVITVLGWYRHTPVGVLALESQDLLQPEDLIGKRIGLPGRYGADYVGLVALLAAAGLDESDINLDLIGFNQVDALLAEEVDAIVGDLPGLSIPLFVAGVPVVTLPVAHTLHLVSFGLVTNEETILQNPDLVRRMVTAVLSGIRFTIAHPEDAFEFSQAFVDDLGYANAAPQMDILNASIQFYQADPLGYSAPEAWENTQSLLLETGLLTTPLDLSAAFSNDFIRK
jgi:NitT/TauT family transport system substrate-binding protein